MLRVEELRMPLVEIFGGVITSDVCKVQEIEQVSRLILYGVEVDANLLGDWILCTCIVQLIFFRDGLGLLIDFVEHERAHD